MAAAQRYGSLHETRVQKECRIPARRRGPPAAENRSRSDRRRSAAPDGRTRSPGEGAGSSSALHPFAEKAQQLTIVRDGRGNGEQVDANRPEAPSNLLLALCGAPSYLGRFQIDQTHRAALCVDHPGESAGGEPLLARIADGERDHIMATVQSTHGPLEVEVEEIRENDDYRALP